MTFLVDTSVIIEILRDNETAHEFVTNHPKDKFLTSCLCEAEIIAGIYSKEVKNISTKREQAMKTLLSFDEIIPFGGEQTDQFGKIYADLADRGQLIEDMDILIAAVAIYKGATLWTKNPKHFSRIKNLEILPLEPQK